MRSSFEILHAMALTSLVGIAVSSVGCDTRNDSAPLAADEVASVSISGEVLKARVDAAIIEVLDSTGHLLARGDVANGAFTVHDIPLRGPFVRVRTLGGHYLDEASGLRVDIPSNAGLGALIPIEALRTRGHDLLLTPETTIVAGIGHQFFADGQDLHAAIAHAEGLYHDAFILGTSPLAMRGTTEVVMHNGSVLAPTTEQEALAQNRAMAFSYYAGQLGLGPEDAFDLMDALVLDLHDGVLDGMNPDGPVYFTGVSGEAFFMDRFDHHTSYGQARARMMEDHLWQVVMGDASSELRHALELMGMHLAPYDDRHLWWADAASTTASNLAADDLPDFQHLPEFEDEDGNPDDDHGFYTLAAQDGVDVTIRAPGTSWTTPMLRYNGLQLPPVIRARRGEELFLTLVNQLDEPTTIHWHGFEVSGPEDGGPTDPIASGLSRQYHFTLDQPAASLWFHPHPHGATGEQVYRGLAGVFILSDQISRTLQAQKQLPDGPLDIPIVIQDRRFNPEISGTRTLVYEGADTGWGGMLGDVVLVNGAMLPRLAVGTRQYLLRLYNGSNARTYDLALSDGAAFHVVGSDGGLLPEPIPVNHVTLGAGERADIVIDFAAYAVDERVMLVSRPFMGGAMMGMVDNDQHTMGMIAGSPQMHGGHMGGGNDSGVPYQNGEPFDVMRFDVTRLAEDDITLYDRLPDSAEIHSRWAVADSTETRSFVMSFDGQMGSGRFVINGKRFSIDRIDEFVRSGATEIWEIRNMSPSAHPFHAHAIQWQVLDRNGHPPSGAESGWKDTVLLWPGDTVRIIGRFGPQNFGQYVYHCHILEHEDAGMMGLFEVQ
jgi:FtsP/CotA-like multicopper oxidase with cupredoxin domain